MNPLDVSQSSGSADPSIAGLKEIPRTNVSLPDIEDTSMNNVFTYLEFYEQDLAWSFLSDSFFIGGGVLYVLISIGEWQESLPENTNCDACLTISKDIYSYLVVVAPLAYVLNSIVDIQWSFHARTRNKKKMRMKDQWSEYQDIGIPEQCDESKFSFRGVQQAPLSRLQLLRKHAAHRRSVLAAFTFGAAALLGFCAVLIKSKKICHVLDFLSAHMYILSAVVSISGRRTRPWFTSTHCNLFHSPELLEDIGDALFLIGSLVDASLVDFDLEQPQLSILSSFLWLIDACFYLRSDFVMAYQMNCNQDLDDAFVLV